jgi:hypothetical protein
MKGSIIIVDYQENVILTTAADTIVERKKTQYDEQKSRELTEKIKSFSIIEYANMIGFTPIQKGKYYSLKEHDSVIIDPYKNCFWRNSTGAKGSIVDFSIEFENKDVHTALADLSFIVNGNDTVSSPVVANKFIGAMTPSAALVLPERDNNIKNVYAYLIGTRKIDKGIISDFIARKNLYQDEYKNCVFVGYNSANEPNFACKRGTNTQKRFVADIEGSDYNSCFYLDNKADTLIVTESVIDNMSVMSIMKEQGKKLCEYNYLGLSGTNKLAAVTEHIKADKNINKLVLALDNDNAGLMAIEKIKEQLKSMDWQGKITDYLPKQKDWNAELQYITEKNFRPNYFEPTKAQHDELKVLYATVVNKNKYRNTIDLLERCTEHRKNLDQLNVPFDFQNIVAGAGGQRNNWDKDNDTVLEHVIGIYNQKKETVTVKQDKNPIANYCNKKGCEMPNNKNEKEVDR